MIESCEFGLDSLETINLCGCPTFPIQDRLREQELPLRVLLFDTFLIFVDFIELRNPAANKEPCLETPSK